MYTPLGNPDASHRAEYLPGESCSDTTVATSRPRTS